jgi:hypothetical protein
MGSINAGTVCRVNYPILVTERHGAFELRIRELRLVVRAPTLQQGYDRLTSRLCEILAHVQAMDALDELPPPGPARLRPHLPRLTVSRRRSTGA